MRMGWQVALLALGATSLACGGDSGDDGNGPDQTIAMAPGNSGDDQAGTALTPLTDSIRVMVTEGGAPAAGVTVTWATTVAGGSVSPATSVTDADGFAATRWTVGAVNGSQLASARVSGAGGSPVIFSATVSGGSGAIFGNTFFRSNKNLSDDPAVDTILAGGTFKWWGTGGSHTVRSTGATSFTSSLTLTGDETYSVTFPVSGVYEYDCQIHTSAMTGRVVVLAPPP